MLVLVIMATFSLNPVNLVAEDVVETIEKTPCMVQESDRECVERLVGIYAKKYKVSAGSMMNTLENENHTFDFDRQSGLKYKKGNRWKQPAGSREQSFGIAQIHLPDHPNVTMEEATDPEFAVEFMAQNFAKGKQSMWMGYEK